MTQAQIQQAFNVASVRSFPGDFVQDDTWPVPQKSTTALFELENVGGTVTLVNNLQQADRVARANRLLAEGYQSLMLYDLCWLGYDHYQTFMQWELANIPWYPARYINGKLQPNPGEPGQYALPGAFEEDAGLLGPYPTSKPDGWITVPPVSQLSVAGADVAALLKAWF